MKPWGTRRKLVVKGRQNSRVTVVVEVYCQKVWMIVVDPPFEAEAILEPVQVDNLIGALTQAATEARDGTNGAE
jgi:hypothetical protein